jgi:acyl carrier protein
MSKHYKKKIFGWFQKRRIKIQEKTDLFLNNKLDSFGFIELLVYIENEFKIKLDNKKLFLKKKLSIKDLIINIINSENKKIKKQ